MASDWVSCQSGVASEVHHIDMSLVVSIPRSVQPLNERTIWVSYTSGVTSEVHHIRMTLVVSILRSVQPLNGKPIWVLYTSGVASELHHVRMTLIVLILRSVHPAGREVVAINWVSIHEWCSFRSTSHSHELSCAPSQILPPNWMCDGGY